MSLYRPSEHCNTRQTGSWRDKSPYLQQSEPQYVLDFNGVHLPLILCGGRSEAGSLQVLAFDHTMFPEIAVKVAGDEVYNRLGYAQQPRCPQMAATRQESKSRLASGLYRTESSYGVMGVLRDRASQRDIGAQARGDFTSPNSRHPTPTHFYEKPESMSVLAAVAASNPEAAAKYNYRPNPSSRDINPDNKIYCSYWIRHGECDYMQQGCRYKHEMPDLQTLRSIGFQGIPRWYREKVSLATARSGHPSAEFLKKIGGNAAAESDFSSPDTTSHLESKPSFNTTTGPRVARNAILAAVDAMANREAQNPVSSSPLRHDYIGPEVVRDPMKRADSPIEDLLVDLDSPASPYQVPNNSPEPAFRKGRFIPAGEEPSARVTSRVTPCGILPTHPALCPSPIRLGSPVSTVPTPAAPFPPSESTSLRYKPKYNQYFPSEDISAPPSPQQVPRSSQPTASNSKANISDATEQKTMLERENEALKARLEASQQQKNIPASCTRTKKIFQKFPAHSLAPADSVASIHRGMRPRTKEKSSKETSRSERKRHGSSRAKTPPKSSQMRKRKAISQVTLTNRDETVAVAVAAGDKGIGSVKA